MKISNMNLKGCNIQSVGGSFFHEAEIMEACVQWCDLVGFDSTDEKIFTAFCMGAKLAISNNGWCNCKKYVVKQSEQLVCSNCKCKHSNKDYDGYCSQSCFDGI